MEIILCGKQTRELLGERDLSMREATAVIARGIGKPDLRYVQFPYDQVQQVLTQKGKCLFKINFILITKSLDDPFNILNQG